MSDQPLEPQAAADARRGISGLAAYLPHWRLQRSAITQVLGSSAGKGTRTVASYDEDSVTMAVEAGRRARRGTNGRVDTLWFASTTGPYAEKTAAPLVHAALRLDGGDGLTAAFAPGAGMVGVSLRDGDDELLGQRHGLAAYAREYRTMGIPLLHPWANRLDRDEIAVAGGTIALRDGAVGLHRDPNGLAIHGLLAGLPEWILAEQEGAAFSATFDFGAHPELLATFPFPHELRLDVALRGRTLRIATTVTPTGDCPVPLAYGFHPYLTLPGVPRERWLVELPACSRLALDARAIPTGATQAQPPTAVELADRAFDDAYVGVADGALFALSDPDDGRRIEVTFEHGYAAAQVYAPLSEPVVCFEPMTAPTNALVSGESLRLAGPGAAATAAFSIAVPRN